MKVKRINKVNIGKLRAFVDIETEEGFEMKGFKLIEHNDKMFVGSPSIPNSKKDGEYDDVIWFGKIRDELNALVLEEYAKVQDKDDIPF